MKRFDIHLVDRTLEIESDGVKLDLGDGLHFRYSCVQDAVARALVIISLRLNVRGAKEVLAAFTSENITIQIHGDEREIRVAALHLHLLHGFPAESVRLLGTTAIDGPSPYETVRFGNLRSKIDAAVRLLEAWEELLRGEENEHSRWVRTKQRRVFYELAWGRQGLLTPLRIGVTGATGAGKSSFINALVGRELLPTADSIATAVVTEIVHARDDEPEELRVTWISPREMHDRISILKAQSRKLLSADDEARRHRELKGLQRARDERNRARSQIPIGEVARFVQLDARDGFAQGVERVELRIHHHLLSAITLVDTPGLRDPDPLRRAIALNEVASTDAWVYLVPAPQKPTTSVEEDWELLRKEAHNDAGAMILTQLDVNLMAPKETLEERRTFYRGRGWRGAIEAVALGGRLSLLKPGDEATDGLYSFSSFMARRWPSDSARVHLISSQLDAAFQRSLSDQAMLTVLADYVADAGGLVACLDLIAVTVAEHGLTQRTSRAIETLVEEVDSVLARVRELRDETGRAVSTCRSIETLRVEVDRLTKLYSEAQEQHDAFETGLGRATQELRQCIVCHLAEIDREAATRTGLPTAANQHGELALDRSLPVWASLNRRVRDDGPMIWGRISFDIFEAFDAPLSACGTSLLALFTIAVNTTLSTLGVNLNVLESSRLTDGFSLHRSDSEDDDRKTIDDNLKWHEFKTTALKRMERAVLQRTTEVLTTMKRKVSARMEQQLQVALRVADEHLDGSRQRITNLEGLLKQQRESEAALRRQTAPEQARAYELRLADLSLLTARMEDFCTRVRAQSTQARS